MNTKRICILGLDDYPMLAADASLGHIGGESVQHVLLARAWRDLGLDVSIIVYDHGQPRLAHVDGIHAVSSYRPQAGLPGVRFLQRTASIVRAMRSVDADVYYQSPAGMLTGLAVWFARERRKQSIVRIASDLGCIPGAQLTPYARDRKMYEYGLRRATLIAAQTQHQQNLLRDHYGLRSELVNMLVEVPVVATHAERDIDVLWVGNLRPVKRPEIVLEIARALPNRLFVIAGGPLPRQQAYFDRISELARAVPNVEMLGPVAYDEVGPLFERAKVHLNTSSAEGFPNTFLQAWARRVPVISFFDPDRLIERCNLGRKCHNTTEMISQLEQLLANPQMCADIGGRARRFVEGKFSPRAIAARYLELLDAEGERRVARTGAVAVRR